MKIQNVFYINTLKYLIILTVITAATSILGVKAAINGLSFDLNVPGFNGSIKTSEIAKLEEGVMQRIPVLVTARNLDLIMQSKNTNGNFVDASVWKTIYATKDGSASIDFSSTLDGGTLFKKTYRLFIDSRPTYITNTRVQGVWYVY